MEHSRYVMIETILSVILNTIVGGIFVFVMFSGMERIGLWGEAGLAFDLVPTVFMITLMTTIALTLLTRSRVKAGKVAPMRMDSRLPTNPILRGLVLALTATIALVPASVLILWLIWPTTGDWSFMAVLVFKCVFSAALGLLVTPIIVRNALKHGTAL